ncbi:MAG: two-component system, cell cycle sensor histidine kinase and response regulator CckA [Gemmatimonadales bacterium]|nr:two-component system, cell cycle sensor histidine kinase and response regulator CckA [Gemmatimonadales bacterium]
MSEPLHLLLLEHADVDVELCLAELDRGGFDVRADVVATQADFETQIRANTYDVVLADYRLPGWTGMGALAVVQEYRGEVPLILVTGTLGEELAVDCLRQGVADYVIKQNLARLPLVVRRVLEERHAREESARAQDTIRRLTLAVDQSPASVIITDTAGRIEYVNQRFVEMTGHSALESLGQSPRLLKSGQTPPEVYEDMWQTIQQGQVWRGELQNRTRNDTLTWHSVTISPVRDPQGTVTHFLATQEDIAERKRAEEALAESEALYRKVIEASFDAIDITEEGVVREANQGFAEMFGYTLDEVKGRPMLDFVADESVEAVRQRKIDGIEGSYELVGKRKDGTRILLEATAKSHRIAGRPVRLTALRDVTEKRQLEEQFRQAQKMEAVGRLAGGVAHDFNNQLTVITSCTELLLMDTEERDPRRDNLEEIRKAAQGAAALTRQLLAFSRQQVVEPKLVTIEEVVASAEKMLKRLIGEDVELVAVLSEAPATVKIDPSQLEQVIMNLAVNARDAMPDGGKLTLETSAVELGEYYARTHWPAIPGRFALLAVSDTGIGMTDQTRARIFEPFFTTKELGKGTGLGLATVYGIVKQSGGFIWVYSEPGQGATFRIYLPRVDEPPMASPPVASTASLLGTETILLTEDAPALRGMARQILERYGYTVLEAPDGKEALALARSVPGPIHLLLTDVVMPGMSGRELAERFTGHRSEMKVLYMSGYTDDAVVRHGVLRPGIAYLQKPFTPESLAHKVREVLDSASLPDRR